mgnify:CR=1 FL=1
MSTQDVSRAVAVALSRRKFLGGTATTTLSAAAVGVAAGSGGLFPRRGWATAHCTLSMPAAERHAK